MRIASWQLLHRSLMGVTLLGAISMMSIVSASALASVHPLSGNARFQIGDGLPQPVGFTALPDGKAVATSGAVVSQPDGADPRPIVFAGGEIKHAPLGMVWLAVVTGSSYLQAFTSIGISYPQGPNILAPGGREGHTTVHYCAGQVVTPVGDPGCASPGGGTGINGLMIYTATGAQFGGAMSGRIFGSANVALYGGSSLPPCSGAMCIVAMALASPNSTGTGNPGNAFGGSQMSAGGPPPSGILSVNITAMGLILSANPTPMMNPGIANPTTAAGGPWTTGMLTVSVTAALAGAEVFVLSGGDSRVSGVGAISLVSGGMSNRGISGPNANRGWLNLVVGSSIGAVPSTSAVGLALLVGLVGLAGGYATRARWRRGNGRD